MDRDAIRHFGGGFEDQDRATRVIFAENRGDFGPRPWEIDFTDFDPPLQPREIRQDSFDKGAIGAEILPGSRLRVKEIRLQHE
jgi:hypothetical protein